MNIRSKDDTVRRMRALEHRVHEAGATRREEFAGGVAYFNDALPAIWDLNFMRLDRECEQPALEAERLQAGLGHRKVLVEESRLAERFRPGLRERGFGERRLVVMARAPGGELDSAVRELRYDELRPVRRIVMEEQVPGGEAVREQVLDAGALAEGAGGRWVALCDGGRPAAYCVVYSHDGLAQIEDVATPASLQRRGFARRLLGHVLEALAADHDRIFMVAEADDWPAKWYRRLGFEPVEKRSEFLLIVAASG